MTRCPSIESIAVIGPVLEAFVTVRPIQATVGAFSRIAELLVMGGNAQETATEATSLSLPTSCQR